MFLINIIDLFQGIGTMFSQEPRIVLFRILLILLGILLVYLGGKKILEPLIMIPMGFGMSAVRAGVLCLEAGRKPLYRRCWRTQGPLYLTYSCKRFIRACYYRSISLFKPDLRWLPLSDPVAYTKEITGTGYRK